MTAFSCSVRRVLVSLLLLLDFVQISQGADMEFLDCGVLESGPDGTCLLFVAGDSRVFTLGDYGGFVP
jgi:hypothetical protein